jgi:hypothetical protein
MFDQLSDGAVLTCEGADCTRPLGDPAIVFETTAGRREAYECACGSVTVTVARRE